MGSDVFGALEPRCLEPNLTRVRFSRTLPGLSCDRQSCHNRWGGLCGLWVTSDLICVHNAGCPPQHVSVGSQHWTWERTNLGRTL